MEMLGNPKPMTPFTNPAAVKTAATTAKPARSNSIRLSDQIAFSQRPSPAISGYDVAPFQLHRLHDKAVIASAAKQSG